MPGTRCFAVSEGGWMQRFPKRGVAAGKEVGN